MAESEKQFRIFAAATAGFHEGAAMTTMRDSRTFHPLFSPRHLDKQLTELWLISKGRAQALPAWRQQSELFS
jgi:hypothetical protein